MLLTKAFGNIQHPAFILHQYNVMNILYPDLKYSKISENVMLSQKIYLPKEGHYGENICFSTKKGLMV